jgi:hypothetical protein
MSNLLPIIGLGGGFDGTVSTGVLCFLIAFVGETMPPLFLFEKDILPPVELQQSDAW